MNDYMTLGIISTFVCLLMATMFMSSRFHYSIKTIAAIIVVIAAIYNWELFLSVLGFPISERPPDNSVILYTVQKPDKNAIYAVVDGPIPRTYTLPYSDELNKKIKDAKKQLERMEGQMVYKTKKPNAGKGKSKANKGQNSQGKSENETENASGEKNGNTEEEDSILDKIGKTSKEIIHKLKTTINIGEDDGMSDVDPKFAEKFRKNKEGKFTDKFDADDTIPDDIEVVPLLPPK